MRPPPATLLRCTAYGLCLVLGLSVASRPLAAAAAPPTPSTRQVPAHAGRTIVDHAVRPAGGLCRGCGQSQCQGCRPMARGHHDGCRAGHCHPYCPVRPQEFGFYETNWRRWPASGVVPATNLEAATPAAPPRSEVPNADEEAAMLPTDESPVPEEGAAFRRGPQERPEAAAPQKTDRGAATMPDRESRPAVVTPPVPQGPQQPVPAAPQKAPPPPVKRPPPAQPQPPAKPSSSPEKDLFDESRAPAPLRRQTASGGPAAPRPIPMAASALPRSSGVEPAVVEVPLAPEPPALDTPRVRFEPAAEALRLRRTTPPTR